MAHDFKAAAAKYKWRFAFRVSHLCLDREDGVMAVCHNGPIQGDPSVWRLASVNDACCRDCMDWAERNLPK